MQMSDVLRYAQEISKIVSDLEGERYSCFWREVEQGALPLYLIIDGNDDESGLLYDISNTSLYLADYDEEVSEDGEKTTLYIYTLTIFALENIKYITVEEFGAGIDDNA
ncbi:MAG: hypothetical protein ACTSRS_18975 [Candidatus Helarchaeota archaeon]